MLDVFAAIKSGKAKENFEYWGLGEEEIDAVRECYSEKREKLRRILDERTPSECPEGY